ncbi:LOW QUALITY PROTEIN: death-associated protein 1-like [Bombina bombina]|uniref:LOW QUALITY PROTEIN: death-associated protein 1-like n=1 Tax=Bombina bombina TaxID=8345 RepID=UPI00235A9CC6|nr:LOW QUALITY PROTEIN: death-associated protein 1-like [Bombina bombina]
MSSPPKEKSDTKAGHPPAVKAGGMRIVQKHPHTHVETKEEKESNEENWESGIVPPKPPLIISGAVTRGDKDSPPAAAQVAHHKHHASVKKLPGTNQVTHHIHQPRK